MELSKIMALWTRVRDSLWFIPGVCTLGAVILAIVMVQLDLREVVPLPSPTAPDADGPPQAVRLAFAGTADGARSVLNAIAAGLITVTGVVFSVTIVAIQLASTQFTPRILRNFTADRGNQVVLGVFIGTFTYALLVQRVVRGGSDEVGSFVPHLSVTVAMALTLVSIGFLIYFIDHAARSVQAAVIIDRVTADALRTIQRTLPDRVGDPAQEDAIEPAIPSGTPTQVTARSGGYVQGVDQDALLELLEEQARTIRLEPHVGDFVMAGSVLATVWPEETDQESPLVDGIREAFILGYERTPHLDPELGVVELVDIAVKALSPGINDPTTATICLDRLSQIVVEFGRREPPARVHHKGDRGGALILPRPEFSHMVATAFDQIRHFGAGNPHFAIAMLRRLAEIGRLLRVERHPPLARQVEALLSEALASRPEPGDAARVERAAAEARAVLGGRRDVAAER